MKFNIKRIIFIAVVILFVIVYIVFRRFFTSSIWGTLLLIAFLIGYLVCSLIWWRCPHCGSYLGKISPFANFCPFCGNKLN